MPINWDKFEKELDGIISESAAKTDAKLASKISSITRLTDDEVKKLFPNPSDAKKVAELMRIVKSSEDKNVKVNKIVKNSEKFGGIVLTLLSKLG